MRSRAPRTWGWTAAPSGGASGIQPSPTHVGMDRAPLPQAVLLRTEPHARGDGPTPRPRRPRPSPRAPRTWGWTSGVRATTFTARPSPTHVGMDRRGPRSEERRVGKAYRAQWRSGGGQPELL